MNILNILFPTRCVFCQKFVAANAVRWVCNECEEYYVSHGAGTADFDGGGRYYYALPYSGYVNTAIRRYKFNNRPQYAETLASFIAPVIADLGKIDYITWAPVHKIRKYRRGYDQSGLLARCLSKSLGIPAAGMLVKTRNTRKQSSLGAEARRKNVVGVYRAADVTADARRVVLLDDVITTGSTILECKRALEEAGVGDVICVALAHRVRF